MHRSEERQVSRFLRQRRQQAAFMCFVAIGLGAGALSFWLARRPAAPPRGVTYYVSPSGSDGNKGTDPRSPWRTIRRVNDAALAPGDKVLFKAGATFSGATLTPDASGTSGAPIAFGSYGRGRATIADGIGFVRNHVTIENLNLHGTLRGGSATHGRSDYVTIDRVSISLPPGNQDLGIYSDGNDWRIEHSSIRGTGLSGMLLNGSDYVVSHNTITDTGLDKSAPYNSHGIYLDARSATITDNEIEDFSSSGISVRYRDSTITGNSIVHGSLGIDFFQTDSGSGFSQWTDNTITGTTAAGIYVSSAGSGGSTHESFLIESNTIDPRSGVNMNLANTTGAYLLASNQCSAAHGPCPSRLG